MTVTGHGKNWSVALSDDGASYLDNGTIEIQYDESGRYDQLVKTTERFQKIPEGMQVTVRHD